ncbi:MAG: hypothetical protein WC224_04585 [Sphaerochaetaceae bacterium]
MDTSEIEKVEEQNNKREGHAIASLILGIFSVISPLQILGCGSIIGLILAIIGLYQVSLAGGRRVSNLANAGKILSIIGLILSALAIVATLLLFTHFLRFSTFHFRPMMMRYRFMF